MTSSDVGADLEDWMTPLLKYLCDQSVRSDRIVRWSAFKYVLHNDELYQKTIEDLLLKCLGSNQARVAMGEVHECIYGTHLSARKMKWLLRRAGFYWPTMILLNYRPIAFVTKKVAKSARSLEIFILCLLLCFILSSNHVLFVVGG